MLCSARSDSCREDAFRAWYVVGFVVNFAAAVYALVRLGYSGAARRCSAPSSLPSACPSRRRRSRPTPLSLRCPARGPRSRGVRSRGQLRQLALAAFWTTWQFYCSIYTGYFLSLLLLALLIGHALCHRGSPIVGLRSWHRRHASNGRTRQLVTKAAFLLTMTVLAALMVLLCAPYVRSRSSVWLSPVIGPRSPKCCLGRRATC